MNNNYKISIIIPVYNKSEFTDLCLNKIFHNTCSEIPYEIIIVDNASTDNTQEIVNKWRKEKNNVKYFRLDQNYRFGYACNYGSEKAEGNILCFLNNDTEVQKNWLRAAIDRLEFDDTIGIVGAKLLYPDNTIQHCGIEFFHHVNSEYNIWPLHRLLNSEPDNPAANYPEEVHAVTGAALFIKKSLFNEVDKFDLNYKMYFEDTDLCFKVRKKGYKIFYEPECVIIHHEGKSSPNQEEIDNLNRESAKIFYSKWSAEIKELEVELKDIEETNHFYTVYNQNLLSRNNFYSIKERRIIINEESFKELFIKLLSHGKAYYHFGGAGDALLLLATFYDENPEQTIISFANSTKALKVFFGAFPKLKHVHIIPIIEDPITNGYVRKLLPGFSNVLGMGVTPTNSYEEEWDETINLFEDYNVKKAPKWIADFKSEKLESFQVVIAPMGSKFGMYKSKKNIINPQNWENIINFITSFGISPIIIGVPSEETDYPILEGCINKRSYSFKEQMNIIATSDVFIGADSWGKTFAALAQIPTIVFKPLYGDDLKGWKDNSDYIFLDPWENITVVNDLDEFYEIFKQIEQNHGNIGNNISEKNKLENISTSSNQIESDFEVLWNAPIFDNSGYADESRNFVVGLINEGINLKINSLKWNNSIAELPFEMKKVLEKAQRNKLDYTKFIININHITPINLVSSEEMYNIGRTMFETDSLPMDWVEKCNSMDEIWVPSDFNIASFSNAGVKKNKLFKIPEAVDTELFLKNNGKIEKISSIPKFKFLSIFDWLYRKGWDVLLKAFIEEFVQEEAVLIIKTWSANSEKKFKDIKNEIRRFLKKELNLNEIPSNIVFYDKMLSISDFPMLYNSVDAYVSPNRGEGWGRPLMEAMLKGLPTIGTRCTGQLEFMTDNNSFLIDCKLSPVPPKAIAEIPFVKGHNWYEPSIIHLKKLMRKVFEGGDEIERISKNAHITIKENFNQKAVAKKIINRLNEILEKEAKKENSNNLIIWEGKTDSKSSLAKVNFEMIKELNSLTPELKVLSDDNVREFSNLLIDKNNYKSEKLNIGIHIRHEFPPNLTPPESGRWVIIQPWEFGSLPKKWVEVFSKSVDEMWVPSSYVKQCYLDSGIPESRVFVIPNGFNPKVYNKEKSEIKLQTKKKFKFLFVGGTIYRKGIDILLKAYTEQFSANDDVCLIIKDMGGDSFYGGQTFTVEINKIKNNKTMPEIEYINNFLTEEELKALYQSVDVLVHPYRGEGFGLPILEAMACGTPVIVTNGGAALDFCNPENSFLVNAEKTYYKDKKVGNLDTVSHPWLFEVNNIELKKVMQYVIANKNELSEKGENAYRFVHESFTWKESARKINGRIKALLMKPILRDENRKVEKNKLFTESIAEAFNLIEQNNYSTALEKIDISLNNYVEKNKNEINLDELLVIKGNLHFVSQNLEKAKEAFEAALNENPNSSTACQGLGDIFQSIEEYEAAKTMFEWAVKNDKTNLTALEKLKTLNQALGLDENNFSLSEDE